MPPVIEKSEKPLIVLANTVATVTSLLDRLEAAIKAPPTTTTPPSDIDALSLAHDAAKLIRAHVTKLSLLIINTPFTPTAIVTVLRELASTPLPSLATAIEICDAQTYTNIVRVELLWREQKVFSELKTFLKEIPLDGKVLTNDQRDGTGDTAGRGSLASTGVLWQTCDSLMELKNLGIAGIVVKKAEQYRDTLKDAIEELQEWGDEESEDEDGFEDANTIGDLAQIIPNATQDEIDNLFASPSHIPSDDPDQIRPRLELSLRRLKLTVVMFNALIKRRFKTLSTLSLSQLPKEIHAIKSDQLSSQPATCVTPAQRVDTGIGLLQEIPDFADNLANSFYELDTEQIDTWMDSCFFRSIAVTELFSQDWGGNYDEFSTWARSFKIEMKK